MTYRIIIRVESEITSRGTERVVAEELPFGLAHSIARALENHIEDEAKHFNERGEHYAKYRRRLHFQSGPYTKTFYACEQHRDCLIDVSNFLPLKDEPIVQMDLEQHPDIDCDFCREG